MEIVEVTGSGLGGDGGGGENAGGGGGDASSAPASSPSAAPSDSSSSSSGGLVSNIINWIGNNSSKIENGLITAAATALGGPVAGALASGAFSAYQGQDLATIAENAALSLVGGAIVKPLSSALGTNAIETGALISSGSGAIK